MVRKHNKRSKATVEQAAQGEDVVLNLEASETLVEHAEVEAEILAGFQPETPTDEIPGDELAELEDILTAGAPVEPEVTPETVAAMTDAELDQAITEIESNEATQIDASPEAPQEPDEQPSFDDLVTSQHEDDIKAQVEANDVELQSREAFELTKDPSNTNIHRTIKKAKASLVRTHAAAAMLASNVGADWINRSLSDGSRYNVYAVLKFADLVDGLAGSGMKNAINIACMRSLFAFRKAGIEFTGEMARAAASDKIRVAAAVKDHLFRHTVSASTAPTQASSTMQAAETLGIVKVLGTRRNPTFVVLDTPQAKKMETLIEAMAA